MGDYSRHLETFGRYFAKERMLIIFFEDIVRGAKECLERICRHIGVDTGSSFDLGQRSNETVYPRVPLAMPVADAGFSSFYRLSPVRWRRPLLEWRLKRLFSGDGHKDRMSPAQRQMAINLHRPSIARLAAWTGADLTRWLTLHK